MAIISKIFIKKPSMPKPEVPSVIIVLGKFLMDSLKNVNRYIIEKIDLRNKIPIKKFNPRMKLDFVFR